MASFSLLLRRCLRGKGRCFGHNRDPCNHALLLCPVCAPATKGFKVPENLHWVPISRPGPAAPGSPAATRRRQNQCFIVREMSSVESPRWGFRFQPCHLLARILYLFFSYIKWQFIFILLYIRDATRLLFLECKILLLFDPREFQYHRSLRRPSFYEVGGTVQQKTMLGMKAHFAKLFGCGSFTQLLIPSPPMFCFVCLFSCTWRCVSSLWSTGSYQQTGFMCSQGMSTERWWPRWDVTSNGFAIRASRKRRITQIYEKCNTMLVIISPFPSWWTIRFSHLFHHYKHALD